MARIALGIEYDGTDFVGWQLQREGRSVQAAVEAAVSAVADSDVIIHGSGRTDAGVHAARQVVHFDTDARRTPRQWVLGINANLPEDVAIQWAHGVSDDFDARRSAVWRRYRYAVLQQPVRSALQRRRAWWLRESLDCAAMTQAAVAWFGENDFSAFRAAGCQSKSAMRRFMGFRIRVLGPLLELDFQANAFLQHMVRNFVGALVEVGRGRQPASWTSDVLASRDRTLAGVTAPPQGLTLMQVAYPAHFGLPYAAAPLGEDA
jgi:tRNA pseudouridine38-40 synthase